jgi:hypothetical protein
MSFARDSLTRDFLDNQIEPILSKTSVQFENGTRVYTAFLSSARTPTEVYASTYDVYSNSITDLPGGVVRLA